MSFLDLVQELSLPAMFLTAVGIAFAICWTMIGFIRWTVRASGHDMSQPLPLRDTVINALGTLFALMMAFSAAGIWNDAMQARAAVQREANALETVLALASSLPADLHTRIRDKVHTYGRHVVDKDWPAMLRKTPVDDPLYDVGDDMLVSVVALIARAQPNIGPSPTIGPLFGQLAEARSARLARITIANGGVSNAQWVAMMLIAIGALCAITICHNFNFRMQVLGTHLYTLAVSAAFFVILAHDRPFVGKISVSPTPFVQVSTR